MALISGDLPVLRFLKILHAFFQKMISILGDLPVLNFKRNYLTSRNEAMLVHNSPFSIVSLT
jgi:hypothetical protein